jgi:ATP-dependent RNA helicase RhlE
VTFDDLGLIEPIRRAIREAGYEEPTPIQREAIPPALAGRDILGSARTGTGKTLAFAVPLLQHADRRAGRRPRILGLVLTPTRELAAQIGESFSEYGRYLDDIYHTVVFGGVGERPQIDELRRGVDIVIATPGRLLDLLEQGALTLSDVELFVLDEADRMLDMGFLPSVRRVIEQLPRRRQTLFFSATMPPDIARLAEELLEDPVPVAVSPISSAAENVEHRVYFVDRADKRRLLVELLRDPALRHTLVFTRTKHAANRVAQHLARSGVRATAIHGNKSQGARTRALEGFKDGKIGVLVATDIAARGIDVEGISHVINVDLPNVPETYVHRVGRTARAGASGVALSFCDADERAHLEEIERHLGQHLLRVVGHPYPPSRPLPRETDLTPRKGRRPAAAPPPRRRRSRR